MSDIDLKQVAARLVADLMPIALTVAGTAADQFALALGEAGAAADIFSREAGGPYDLAILLADPGADAAGDAAQAAVKPLTEAADRILLVPAPIGSAGKVNLDAWFELFAEHGFQPVVEYDASFLGQGAFLVDRNATAAESELTAFAERINLGGALAETSQRVAALEAELAEGGDRDRLKKALVAKEAEVAALGAREAAWRNRAEQAEAEAAQHRTQLAVWAALGDWIAAECARSDRNELAALRRARGGGSLRRSWLRWLLARERRPTEQESGLLRAAAAVRACPVFDAPWYLAQRPALASAGGDPVWDYVLYSAAEDANPGPWFDAAAYVMKHPAARGRALLHAIDSGEVQRIVAQSGMEGDSSEAGTD